MAHGLALAVMISCVGHISGAHFNPAVTTGFLVTGRMSAGEWAAYIVSQLLGATLAALLLLALVPGATGTNPPLGGQALAPGVGFGAGVGIEIILTFFLVFTVFFFNNVQFFSFKDLFRSLSTRISSKKLIFKKVFAKVSKTKFRRHYFFFFFSLFLFFCSLALNAHDIV